MACHLHCLKTRRFSSITGGVAASFRVHVGHAARVLIDGQAARSARQDIASERHVPVVPSCRRRGERCVAEVVRWWWWQWWGSGGVDIRQTNMSGWHITHDA